MRRLVAVALLLSIGTVQAAGAEHLVPAGALQERLAEVARDREERIAVVDALLDTPAAERASGMLGVSIRQVKRQVALLSDDDLRDLSLRAESLKTDPAAGSNAAAWAPGIVLAAVLFPCVLLYLLGSLIELGGD
jgi:hypothetical protein